MATKGEIQQALHSLRNDLDHVKEKNPLQWELGAKTSVEWVYHGLMLDIHTKLGDMIKNLDRLVSELD